VQSSFCLYLMHHENGNAGLNKRETAHEVRGTSACADRSGAETSNFRAQDWARK